MDTVIATSGHPFRYEGKEYKIVEAGIKADNAYARVSPPNTELEAEIRRRIDRDRALSVYLGCGYVCFREDYPQTLDVQAD